MCKGKKSIWIILFLYLHLDTLKLCVSLEQCCQPENFAYCEDVYCSSRALARAWLLACFFGRESVGDCVNLLFACLGEPEVLIAVAGFRDPNHIIITASFARNVHSGHWGLLESYWVPNRKTGIVPRLSQHSNLPLTLASSGHLGNWCAMQVKRYHFPKIFFSF